MKKTTTNTLLLALLTALTVTMSGTSLAQTSVTTTTSAGTISEFSPDTIVIRSETDPAPIRYSYSKTTTYVDETGAPVSMTTVKSGLPVTVYYVKDGDRMIANRVVVRKQTTTKAPVAIEEKKTTTTTTTTTDNK